MDFRGNMKLIKVESDKIRDYIENIDRSGREYKLCKAEIYQKGFAFAKADVWCEDQIEDFEGYFLLQNEEDVLFVGQIMQIKEPEHVYLFEARSTNITVPNGWRIFDKSLICKSDAPVFWSSDGFKSFDPILVQKDEVLDINEDFVMHYQVVNSTPKSNNVKVNVSWSGEVEKGFDLTDQISGFQTLTAAKLIKDWPKANTTSNGFNIVRSNVEAVEIEGSDPERVEINGELFVSFIQSERYKEIWNFVVNQEHEDFVKEYYLDLSNYLTNIKEWEARKRYAAGQNALIHTGNRYERAICKEGHIAGENVDMEKWKLCGDLYDVFTEGKCFSSDSGKEMLHSLFRYIILDLTVRGEYGLLEIISSDKELNSVQIGDRIKFEDKEYTIIEYSKVFNPKNVKCQIVCADFEKFDKSKEATNLRTELIYEEENEGYCCANLMYLADEQEMVEGSKKPATKLIIEGLTSKTCERYVKIYM